MAIEYEELKLYDHEQSLKQLLNQKIIRVLEDEERYYIGIDSDEPTDGWDVVDKADNKRYWSTIIDMFAAGVFDKAKEISPEEFKKRVS